MFHEEPRIKYTLMVLDSRAIEHRAEWEQITWPGTATSRERIEFPATLPRVSHHIRAVLSLSRSRKRQNPHRG